MNIIGQKQNSHEPVNRSVQSDDEESDEAESHTGVQPEGGKSAMVPTPVKRACNECRHQKLRCDAIKKPFQACSRCRRLGKHCVVETVVKRRANNRDKYAVLQREIDELRQQLKRASHGGYSSTEQQAVDTPESPASTSTLSRSIGDFSVSGMFLDELFKLFFMHYHPFLPFLDPELKAGQYFELSPLLGWSIVMVAARRFKQDPKLFPKLIPEYSKLLWSKIADSPLSYHMVKSLCLICLWPLPTDSGLRDQTFRLSGIMMQTAIETVLHLQYRAPPADETSMTLEQRDRLLTWTACNFVAQTTSISYGFPPPQRCDWLLGLGDRFETLPKDLFQQVKISEFCCTFQKSFYCNTYDSTGLLPESSRMVALDDTRRNYAELQAYLGDDISSTTRLYLLAANVHLNTFTFFLPASPTRLAEFSHLYYAVCTYIRSVLDTQTSTGTLLEHCSNFIFHTMACSAFALIKLVNSPFANNFDVEAGKTLFSSNSIAAKSVSLQDEDLPSRMSTRTAMLWRALGGGAPWPEEKPDPTFLKVRSRLNVSHAFDCFRLWKEIFKPGDTAAQNVTTATSEQPAMPSVAPVTTHSFSMDQYAASYAQGDPSLLGFDMDNMDYFNSMDWMIGDWGNIPLGPNGFAIDNGLS